MLYILFIGIRTLLLNVTRGFGYLLTTLAARRVAKQRRRGHRSGRPGAALSNPVPLLSNPARSIGEGDG